MRSVYAGQTAIGWFNPVRAVCAGCATEADRRRLIPLTLDQAYVQVDAGFDLICVTCGHQLAPTCKGCGQHIDTTYDDCPACVTADPYGWSL